MTTLAERIRGVKIDVPSETAAISEKKNIREVKIDVPSETAAISEKKNIREVKIDVPSETAAASERIGEVKIDAPSEAAAISETNTKPSASFEDYGLSPQLLRGIYGTGFEKPSEIQRKAIVPIKEAKDTIVQAQSGMGKTGAFSIGLLARMDFRQKRIQAVVLCHTHELASQTNRVISKFGEHCMEDGSVFCQTFIGGTQVKEDIDRIKEGMIVAVCTPGRLLDLTQKGHIEPSQIKIIVIDEADEMLSKGFWEQIKKFLGYVPRDVQIVLVSATMPEEVLKLTEGFMRDPIKILMKPTQLVLDGLKQYYIDTDEMSDNGKKLEVLIDLLYPIPSQTVVVFVNTKRSADLLTRQLSGAGYNPEAIHSDMSGEDRKRIMERFINEKFKVLISTDLMARGIDIPKVSIVINYEMTKDWHIYLHRIGRAGRFGKKGIAINFISDEDKEIITKFENHYEKKIDVMPQNFMEALL